MEQASKLLYAGAFLLLAGAMATEVAAAVQKRKAGKTWAAATANGGPAKTVDPYANAPTGE